MSLGWLKVFRRGRIQACGGWFRGRVVVAGVQPQARVSLTQGDEWFACGYVE
ncbi:hypothetical protein GCM10014713_08510 [Streptomyces purpureus]|uniref:Uncharacterized protein n=1 Tax=Streptomyces purpureus TaxID=1951 RepID=A0A918GYQ6_9ACTN|nr:hypothetical protein GCM10014713_08510 [Streptomyces purpureus]